MTAAASCNCDEAKSWKTRALRAELGLKFARQQLDRLLEKVDGVIFEQEKNDRIDLNDPSEERVPGTWGETVLASGSLPSEARGLDGLLGYSGGSDEERQAAVDARADEDRAR